MAQISAPPTDRLTLERFTSEAVVPSVEPCASAALQSHQRHESAKHIGNIVSNTTTRLVDGVFLGGQRGQEVRDGVESVEPTVHRAGVVDDIALREVPSCDVHDACDDVVEEPERRETT